MPALTALGSGGTLDEGFRLVTVTHARMGEPAFGIAPGYAEVWATLRTLTDAGMAELCAEAEALARGLAAKAGLGVEIAYEDVFVHCENDPEAVAILRRALDAEGVPQGKDGQPMRASEDFGRFGRNARAAMFFLGAGERHPSLHNPDYDFPDELIAIGARVFMRTARELLGRPPSGALCPALAEDARNANVLPLVSVNDMIRLVLDIGIGGRTFPSGSRSSSVPVAR